MKKKIKEKRIALSVTTALTLLLTACAASDEEAQKPEVKSEQVVAHEGLVFGSAEKWSAWGIEAMSKPYEQKVFDYKEEIKAIIAEPSTETDKEQSVYYMAKMYAASDEEVDNFFDELLALYLADSYIVDDEAEQLEISFKCYVVKHHNKKIVDELNKAGKALNEEPAFYKESISSTLANSIKYVYRGIETKGDDSYISYRSKIEKQLIKLNNF